jgi:hypothetical protein
MMIFNSRRQYRLTREGVLRLVDLLNHELLFRGNRGRPLSPLQQVCLALTFYASGTLQRTAGYLAGVKKSCACLTIRRVTRAICQLAPQFVTMPTEQEMQVTSNHFQNRFGLPNFIMGVDGTHVRLGIRPLEADLPPG